ncbi:hypothetical protein [Malacoplasma iowae]|uniref:hypothetical protein n=1 Tax=Malacoplasma iowae TaxID=2116 RepID=UPI00387351B0|nr:hypothetical protein QX181_00945 [Malacoplasma iowae]
MKLILEPLQNNKADTLIKNNQILQINSLDDIYQFCSKSFSIFKTLKGFDTFFKENVFNKKDLDITNYYFLDHSSYVGLFLIFKTEQDILNYVEDTCIGRGEKPVETIDEAFKYLKDDEIKVYKIKEFESLNQDEWEIFYKESIASIKKKN